MKRYPKYKDSGIEWLGEIPEGWEVRKLKYVAHVEMGQSPESAFYNKDGNGAPFLQGNADFKEIYPQPQVWTTEGNKYSKKDDILISVRAPVGEINISDDRYAIGRGLTALRFSGKFCFKYYYYLVAAAKNYFDSISTGTTYSAISTDDVKNISVTVPLLEKQLQIANYLDQKTTKIDELLKKNEKLIELLKEKRQAVISHAVTKGIPPHPPLAKGGRGDLKIKGSGIEWIGEIPEGWEVKRLKFNLQLLTEKTDRRESPVALENIESWLGRYKETESEFQGEGVAFKKGDILFGKLRPYLAKVWLADFSGEAIGDFFVMRPSVNIDGRFAVYQILNNEFISIVDGSTFGAKMPRVSWDFMANLRLLTPPLEEQHIIADYLDRETAKLDSLISKIREHIARLQEYRTALISAAVTGKIDVHGSN